MPVRGFNWWTVAPPPPVKVTVKTPSGLTLVLDANQSNDGNFKLVLSQHDLNALTRASSNEIVMGEANRALTPPPTYRSPPPTYAPTTGNDLMTVLELPPPVVAPATTVPAPSAPSRRGMHQRTLRHATYQPEPRPIRVVSTNTEHRALVASTPAHLALPAHSNAVPPAVQRVSYKIRGDGGARISCFYSSSTSPLSTPSVHATVEDTYVHHLDHFQYQLWIFRRPTQVEVDRDGVPRGPDWFKAKLGEKHPDGGGLFLYFGTNRQTTQWMRYKKEYESRVPGP